MEKTWKPVAAGILNIISGILSLISALFILLGISVLMAMMGVSSYGPAEALILKISAITGIVLGVLSIIGGIFCLTRKYWGLGLTGSITSAISNLVLGVLAIVFIALGKKEFK